MEQPIVDCEMLHPILGVSDILTAIDFYTTKLGFWLAFSENDFAGVNLGRVQVFLERASSPQGSPVYFVVSDANALFAFHRSNGVEVLQSIDDRPYDLRDYTVRDLDGNRLTFGHRI